MSEASIQPPLPDLIELETSRLRLRQWKPSDLDHFIAMCCDPRVMQFFPEPMSEIDAEAMAMRIHALIVTQGWGFWAVEVKGGAPFIGFVGLHIPISALPFSPCVEIGWRLGADHWGKGYATEAAREAIFTGFRTLGLEEIVSFTTTGNLRSRKLMERLGMRHHGERFEHPSVPEGHPLRPHVLYRLRRDDWESGF